MSATLKLLVIGRGRMGRLVVEHASTHGFEVVGTLDASSNREAEALTAERCHGVDVAIEFATADATAANVAALARHGVPVVVGTTGWQAHEDRLRDVVTTSGSAVVAAPNCSLAANVLAALVEHAARLLGPCDEYGAWVHESHHAAKRDAPSGTARMLEQALRRGGLTRAIDVASTRAGHIPGIHEVGFDGPAETLTLTHAVRDRATFAHGALQAARWVIGRRGWFGMPDVLGLGEAQPPPTAYRPPPVASDEESRA